MTGAVKDQAVAQAIVAARRAHPELVPFAMGVGADDDRGAYLNASEAGTCARRLWYDRHEGEGETIAQPGIFDRGHAAEAWAVAMLGAAGLGQLFRAGENQERLIHEATRIAGTPDGLLVKGSRGDRESVVEIKSYGSTVDRSTSPGPANVKQTELNIELFHRTTTHRPKDGLLVYVSAENYTMLHVYRVPRRPAVWLEMIGKAKEVLGAAHARDVVPSPSALCGFCPFRTSCQAADRRIVPLVEKIGGPDVDRLDAAVQDYQLARDEKKKAEAREIESKVKLRRLMNNLGLAKANRPAYSIRIFEEPGGAALDEMALAGVLGDLAPYRRRGKAVERIEVTGK